MNIRKLAGGDNPPTKEPPTGKDQTIRHPTQMEERATLEHPDKEIKETTPLSPIELLS